MKPSKTLAEQQAILRGQQTTQWVAGLDNQLKQATDVVDMPIQFNRGRLETALTANSFWIIYSFETAGKLAIRTCFDPQTIQGVTLEEQTDTTGSPAGDPAAAGSSTVLVYHVDGSLGRFRVRVELPAQEPMLLRYMTSLEPSQDFELQAFPPDLYVLDDDFSLTTEGMLHTKQSGPTSGLAYLSVTKPVAGSVVYFQNMTALNEYCQMTHTDPSGCVTAQWPEVGFSLPPSEQPLRAGQEVILSDAFLCLSETVPQTEFEAADQFLEAIATIYPHLPKPDTTYYDWPKAAEKTIKALSESPDCGRMLNGHFYVNAYVSATYKPPESMVQLAILVPLWEYQRWLGQPVPLVERLEQSLPTFFDETKATLMRWLPGEPFAEGQNSEEEDYDKIDSWYLLHTLMNLGRMADNGHTPARDLLLRSVDFAIKAAHHFNYNWPVFYDSRNLNVLKAETEEGRGGELDVAGMYTHVMLQTYNLTKEEGYLAEARQSAERLRGKGFTLLYQSNITLMSALTMAKLWKLTGNQLYFDLSKLGIANVVAKMWIWECKFGFAQTRSTFMGVAPLRDAEYLAAYEEAEIFATMYNYLVEFGAELPAPVRLLLSEYLKYLLHRGRYYFPTELPPDAISQQPREGRIIRELPIPVEDMSTGWKQVGTVGQEVYGGALAYILTRYAYRQFAEVPVTVFCEYLILRFNFQLTGKDSGYAAYQLGGTAAGQCRFRLLAKGRQLPQVQLFDEDDPSKQPLEPTAEEKSYHEYVVPGNARLRLEWNK